MKKLTILLLLVIGLFSFTSTSYAKETLLDNNLDLKTDRLNQDQIDNGKAQSFIAEDRLFDSEMIDKVANAKKVEEKQRQEDEAQFFLTKVPKTKEYDHTQLFAGNDVDYAAAKKEETVEAVSSGAKLLPLVLGLLLVTVVTLVLYHSRKRGQQNGR
ncbi:type VII secretion protein EssA [Enterococcus sp. DIV0242_7C1]|uniref:Type VII secretion protein EssA n=1 Tax=Candidatus Enterococcus dunnyi TaxID=1834192 RepID=A0A200J0P0_9ENTE|nr:MULTISPECIES: type VII secretion protein EssA [unclassified Enterococcus]MBO0470426.1 type VII secretion protein EssA [Enterococcus sp. DIV0242_7C1]OUZ30210.1 type VII secretion protein EssA [Enterococcus sp. 9D6_DIV0238]